jgi:hypothetical protein
MPMSGKQFERICKWYLQHDPVYAGELCHVWLWKEWPDRWSDAEAGIDLIAEDHQGHLWAIQAKAYDPAYWVTKHDVEHIPLGVQPSPVLFPLTDCDYQSHRTHRQAHDRGPGEAGQRSAAR